MKPLHRLFSEQARLSPNDIAIVDGSTTVSYKELEETSNRIARKLLESGCQPRDRIALLMPKSAAAIASMLGSLKAGCIYVPMDTSSPVARLSKIIDSCEPRAIVVSDSAAHLIMPLMASANGMRVGWLGAGKPPDDFPPCAFCWDELASAPADSLELPGDAGAAAHILFTSGSTGVPKGVVITHSNIVHFLRWAVPYFGIGQGQKISCQPPLHFDLSTFDVYGTLTSGAELHLVPPELGLLPHKVADFIRRRKLTQWFSVPSVLKYMAQFDVVRQGDFPSLERLLWCGEALPTPVLTYLMQRLPHVKFTNLYGPTEATIASSYYTVPFCPADEKTEIPIGAACGGEELFVLDGNLRPVARGEIGDLFIAGAGLSPGYWRDPVKTQSVFLNHPVFGLIYKTGDMAKVGADGLFYLLGRADSQIKSRGYRIELGEIESALYTLDNLRESAVVAVPSDGFEGTSICCAYVPAPGTASDPADLRTRLLEILPPYMIPAQWMAMKSLPLNGNGKVDRPRLREVFREARNTVAAH